MAVRLTRNRPRLPKVTFRARTWREGSREEAAEHMRRAWCDAERNPAGFRPGPYWAEDLERLGLAVPAAVGLLWPIGRGGEYRALVLVLPQEGHDTLPSLDLDPGKILLARVWRGSKPEPYLELRREGAGERVAVVGLEHARSATEAHNLLAQLPTLRRLSNAGRPPLDERQRGDRLKLALRAEKLKRREPGLCWDAVAGRLGVPVSSLHRWRAQLRQNS